MEITNITSHRVNGLNEALEVQAIGKPGPGGAHQLYKIKLHNQGTRVPHTDGLPREWILNFQSRPIQSSADFDGLTTEALLAVLIHRQQGFATGPFSCSQNTDALAGLLSAAEALRARTKDRLDRGVEGQHVP